MFYDEKAIAIEIRVPDEKARSEYQDADSKWYEVLGVREDAGFKEIRAAYRKLMQEYHPDRVANLGKELRDLAERKAKKINEAYESFRKARQPL